MFNLSRNREAAVEELAELHNHIINNNIIITPTKVLSHMIEIRMAPKIKSTFIISISINNSPTHSRLNNKKKVKIAKRTIILQKIPSNNNLKKTVDPSQHKPLNNNLLNLKLTSLTSLKFSPSRPKVRERVPSFNLRSNSRMKSLSYKVKSKNTKRRGDNSEQNSINLESNSNRLTIGKSNSRETLRTSKENSKGIRILRKTSKRWKNNYKQSWLIKDRVVIW